MFCVTLTIVKSPELAPVMETALEKINVALPLLVTVTVRGALVVPCMTGPNASVLVDSETTGAAAVPVPLSGTDCMLGEALSLKSSEALSAVMVEGVKVRLTMQEEFAATWLAVEQVEAVIRKSE